MPTAKHIVEKWIEYLLLAWFLTLPFGSAIGAVSLGFMTLNPSVLISLLLFVPCAVTFFQWSRWEKGAAFFLAGWLIAAIGITAAAGAFHEHAIFDIRSLGMQVIVAVVLFGAKAKLRQATFCESVTKGIFLFTFILFISGVFEWATTIHFAGKTSEKLLDLSASNTVMRAPLFLFDNANDFLLHLTFFYTWSLILSSRLRTNYWLVITGWLVIFVFAVYAQSNFGKAIASGALLICMLYRGVAYLKQTPFRHFVPYAIIVGLFGIVLITKTLFIGPDFANGASYRLNDMQLVEKNHGAYVIHPVKEVLSGGEQVKMVHDIDSAVVNSPEGSASIRRNLIANGWTFIRSNPITGIGPGNYVYRSQHDKQLLYTGTVTNPHCFPIEIISQYGVIGVVYFLLLLLLLINFIRQKRLNIRQPDWLLFLFLVLPIWWSMPSSFLYLDLHRLLLPLLIILLTVDHLPVLSQEGEQYE